MRPEDIDSLLGPGTTQTSGCYFGHINTGGYEENPGVCLDSGGTAAKILIVEMYMRYET